MIDRKPIYKTTQDKLFPPLKAPTPRLTSANTNLTPPHIRRNRNAGFKSNLKLKLPGYKFKK